MGKPRRPQSGKGIGESPAEEDKWWARAQNSVLLRLVFFVFLGSVYYGQIVGAQMHTVNLDQGSSIQRCLSILRSHPLTFSFQTMYDYVGGLR